MSYLASTDDNLLQQVSYQGAGRQNQTVLRTEPSSCHTLSSR
jgi:hypothetical protein